jgi:hypothetical protein
MNMACARTHHGGVLHASAHEERMRCTARLAVEIARHQHGDVSTATRQSERDTRPVAARPSQADDDEQALGAE